MSNEWDRREFLRASGASTLAMFGAGCTDTEPSSDDRTATKTEIQTPFAKTEDTKITEEDPEPSTPNNRFENLVGLETDSHLDTSSQEQISRDYVAYSEDERTTYTRSFLKGIYEFYDNQTRQYVNNYQYKYGSYVSCRLDKYLIDSIVSTFEEYGRNHSHTDRQVIEHMMSFVQNLKYTTDIRGTGFNDYPKYPIETLVEQEGDCEDTSILMANLLRSFGYGTKLIYATADMTDGDAGGHMAVGIKGDDDVGGTYYNDDNGNRFYFIETTAPNTPIGEAPPWMNSAYLQPVGVHPVPGAILGTVTEVQGDQITVTGETVNTGPVGSNRVQIRLSLIDSERYIIDQAMSKYKSVDGFSGNIDDLGQKHQATAEVTLYPNQEKSMRLVAESFVDGEEVSQTESPLRLPN